MDALEVAERNNASYRWMKDTMSQSYPREWFVGIANDQVVGAAANFGDVERVLREQGRDPRSVLVVEAGVDYPEYLTIFV